MDAVHLISHTVQIYELVMEGLKDKSLTELYNINHVGGVTD